MLEMEITKKKDSQIIICILVASCIALIIGAFLFSPFLLGSFFGSESLEYDVMIHTESDNITTVYVPVPDNKDLQEKLSIIYGQGEFKIISTEHGSALEIIFSGNIKIAGSVTKARLGELKNISLSMRNG